MSIKLNPSTARRIQEIQEKGLPHALLLTGDEGVGLLTIARHISKTHTTTLVEATTTTGETDKSRKGQIRVEQIRNLYTSSRSKHHDVQVFIIDEAEKMNKVSQNALLKLLEEPTPRTTFILTSHSPHILLPTIRSRVQVLSVGLLSTDDTIAHVHELGIMDEKKVAQLVYLANGKPAEITRLITSEHEFEKRVSYIADARTLLQGAEYEKLKIIQRYATKRDESLSLVAVTITILKSVNTSRPSQEITEQLSKLADVFDRLAANGNVRIQLLSFVV